MEPAKHDADVSTTSQEIGSASGEKQLPARYQVLTELGEDFFDCWDRDSGKCARVKVIKNTSTRRYGTDRGIALMQYLSMSGVRSFVRMSDYFYHQKQTCIVFETLGPSLFDLMNLNISSPVPLTLIVLYARQLLESVADLHELGVIHTDLKPENIQLVSSAFEEIPNYERTSKFRFLPTSSAIKLFVLSAMFEHNVVKIGHHRPVVTTRNFRAPEIILGLGWSFPVDLWSVGCVLAEMCTGQRLFRIVAESDVEHLALFERVLGKLPKNMTERLYAPGLKLKGLEGDSRANINSHEPLQEQVLRHVPGQFGQLLIDLLKGLLEFEPSKRLTARRALQHQVFRDSH